MPELRRVTGPGRVNLIGDHTDYNAGLALPMAIGLGVTVEFTPWSEPHLVVSSTAFDDEVDLPLDLPADADTLSAFVPAWCRMAAAMVAVARPETGGSLTIDSTLPIGSGLSSSAALSVALAEAFGVTGPAAVVARLCQQAEQRTGIPVGIMDPLVCAGGRRGHALYIDFATLDTRQIAMPGDVDVVIVDSGQRRTVRSSAYAARVAESEAAAAIIGPLGAAGDDDLLGLRDPLLRRRARHVVSEGRRVRACAEALERGDPVAAGALMLASHQSLADDYEVSTPVLDSLVSDLVSRPGVYGARLTGAGFGGCVVALARSGALDPGTLATPAWRVQAEDGTVARRTT